MKSLMLLAIMPATLCAPNQQSNKTYYGRELPKFLGQNQADSPNFPYFQMSKVNDAPPDHVTSSF